MPTAFEVPANELINRLAKHLKENVSEISPPPWSRQGHLTRSLCGNSAELLCLGNDLVGRPLELGSIYPHAVQNHRELARDGDLGFTQTDALSQSHAPRF